MRMISNNISRARFRDLRDFQIIHANSDVLVEK